MVVHDFLTQPTEDRLRREINNICDSYSHAWDVMAELLQNSVDAIRRHIQELGSSEHSIEITIDQQSRSITVRDSGMGIDPDKVSSLLAPHGSDKSRTDRTLIGEKGVGLTYVIFSSNRFKIETASVRGSFKGEIVNASYWRQQDTADLPKLQGDQTSEHTDPNGTYTEIEASGIDDLFEDDDLFRQSAPVLSYILRTKTAIGSTKNEPEAIDVTLRVVPGSGMVHQQSIPFRYMYPEELLGKSGWHDYADFVSKAARLNDQQKAKQLQGKALRKKGSRQAAGRDIQYSALFVPSRKTWDQINEKNGFNVDEGTYSYRGAIEIATRGMPTAVHLSPPTTGFAGYWPNIHIVIEDDSLPFDIGRKSIPGRTQGLLRSIAKDVFNDFVPFAKLTSVDPPVPTNPTLQQHERNQRFTQLQGLPDLPVKSIPYQKHPDSQECAVVAVFHELVGAGCLKGYRTFKTGYSETYDLWGYYDTSNDNLGANLTSVAPGTSIPIVVEFKYKAESILQDFNDNIKFFNDIDLLVCWDFDPLKFKGDGVSVEPVSADDALFMGTNYKLIWPAAQNLGAAGEKPLLSLRHYLDGLALSER